MPLTTGTNVVRSPTAAQSSRAPATAAARTATMMTSKLPCNADRVSAWTAVVCTGPSDARMHKPSRFRRSFVASRTRNDISLRSKQFGAEVAAGCACADDEYPHVNSWVLSTESDAERCTWPERLDGMPASLAAGRSSARLRMVGPVVGMEADAELIDR